MALSGLARVRAGQSGNGSPFVPVCAAPWWPVRLRSVEEVVEDRKKVVTARGVSMPEGRRSMLSSKARAAATRWSVVSVAPTPRASMSPPGRLTPSV